MPGRPRRSPSFARVVELLGVARDVLGRQPELSHKKIEQPALFIAGTRDPVLSFVPGIRLSDLMDPWYTDLRGKLREVTPWDGLDRARFR
jgi:pimeloyl-ACP methyl ester carboxylesterase